MQERAGESNRERGEKSIRRRTPAHPKKKRWMRIFLRRLSDHSGGETVSSLRMDVPMNGKTKSTRCSANRISGDK